MQLDPVHDKSDTLQVVAVLRHQDPIFNRNYELLENILKRWGQFYSDITGGEKLSVEFHLNHPAAGDIGAAISVGKNVIQIPIESLMEENVNAAETAIHELIHGKFYSIHEVDARENLKKRGIDNPTKEQVREETYKVANTFAATILPKMFKFASGWLNSKIKQGGGGKKGLAYLSNVLNIAPGSSFYGASLVELKPYIFRDQNTDAYLTFPDG